VNEMADMNIVFEQPAINPSNAMLDEQISFIEAITNDATPLVSIESATKALEIAEKITELINE
jgi:predicted dehydrogenase